MSSEGVETMDLICCCGQLGGKGIEITKKMYEVQDLCIAAVKAKREGKTALFHSMMKAALDLEHETLGECEATGKLAEQLGYPDQEVEEKIEPTPPGKMLSRTPAESVVVLIKLEIVGRSRDAFACVEGILNNGVLQHEINVAHHNNEEFQRLTVTSATCEIG